MSQCLPLLNTLYWGICLKRKWRPRPGSTTHTHTRVCVWKLLILKTSNLWQLSLQWTRNEKSLWTCVEHKLISFLAWCTYRKCQKFKEAKSQMTEESVIGVINKSVQIPKTFYRQLWIKAGMRGENQVSPAFANASFIVDRLKWHAECCVNFRCRLFTPSLLSPCGLLSSHQLLRTSLDTSSLRPRCVLN